MLEQYIPIGIILLFGMTFAVVFIKVSEWFGPRNPNDVKLSIYESGMEPVKSARERISVKYYMVTMLFIVFDIEVVFLYPWAVNFRELGLFGFVEMLIFIVILLIGLIYIWKKDALKWD
jgi:NADH-quinone oxidoreductase subunit A